MEIMLFFYFTIFTLLLKSVHASNSTKIHPLNVVEECPICYDTITPVQYFQSFNCSHTHIHKTCVQTWANSLATAPTCPICRATSLLKVNTAEYQLSCFFELIDSIQRNSVMRVNELLATCIVPDDSILQLILYAFSVKRLSILFILLKLNVNFTLMELRVVYSGILISQTSSYEELMILIYQRTNQRSPVSLYDEHLLCTQRGDTRCINAFLNWYSRYRIMAPSSSRRLGLQLANFIRMKPLFMKNAKVLVDLPRTLISSHSLGLVMVAQFNTQFNSINKAETYMAVVEKDVVIPDEFMKRILRITLSRGSNLDVERVLLYEYFSFESIGFELNRLRTKSIVRKFFSSPEKDNWIITKLSDYITLHILG